MQILSSGPSPIVVYHYMSCKGYTPNFKMSSGKNIITFTKTLHNAEFPVIPELKGLVIVHKIEVDIWCGKVVRHWLESRYVPINSWKYFELLKDLFEKSVKFFGETRDWMKKGWRESL